MSRTRAWATLAGIVVGLVLVKAGITWLVLTAMAALR